MNDPRGDDFWTARLSAYLDGELANGERRAFEAHLATCASCAAALEELREVVARSRALESRAPDRDLWPAIEARLAPRGAAAAPEEAAAPAGTPVLRPAVPWWRGRRISLGLPQLAAAAVALVALSGGAVWLALHPRPQPIAPSVSGPLARNSAPVAPPPAAGSAPAAVNASFDATRYDAAIAQLQQVLDQHRSELDPHTVQVIEQNLRIIDQATEEARRALAADPANPYLNDHLVRQMRRKVDILRQVALRVGDRG